MAGPKPMQLTVVVRDDGKIITVFPKAVEFFGLTADEALRYADHIREKALAVKHKNVLVVRDPKLIVPARMK